MLEGKLLGSKLLEGKLLEGKLLGSKLLEGKLLGAKLLGSKLLDGKLLGSCLLASRIVLPSFDRGLILLAVRGAFVQHLAPLQCANPCAICLCHVPVHCVCVMLQCHVPCACALRL